MAESHDAVGRPYKRLSGKSSSSTMNTLTLAEVHAFVIGLYCGYHGIVWDAQEIEGRKHLKDVRQEFGYYVAGYFIGERFK